MNIPDVFIRLKETVAIPPDGGVPINYLTDIVAERRLKHLIGKLEIRFARVTRGRAIVITALDVVKRIKTEFPDVRIHLVGNNDCLITIRGNEIKHWQRWFGVALVCLILFFGSAMAVMNFHTDVSMPKVHQQIYRIITGTELENPLIMQIPYSLGIGFGMMLFFNHLFRKEINNEPTPLEVEMFLYQQNVNQYILAHKDEHDLHPGENRL
ncbi:MAG TPA: stage V sporulation protein AA [Negativicutes bacterium]|nr:stage V sporulation protein AA [Negativicutes bacterium]